MFILDMFFIGFIYMLIVMILCGYLSLCERKLLALLQMRIGPGLFFFGILTPITDGLKLFLKFTMFLVSMDLFYFVCSCFFLIYSMFIL